MATSEAEWPLLRSCSTHYVHGDKPNRLLTHQLRCWAASRFPTQIKDPSGSVTTYSTAINSVFQLFYSSLYKSESPLNIFELTSVLTGNEFPIICPEISAKLDSPLTLEEITVAINQIQNNKAPGPEGILQSFTRNFKVNCSFTFITI